MAFPQVVGSQLSSRANSVINDSVTLPASIVAGDLILVFHFSDGALTRTFPSPWVEIKDTVASGDTANIGIAYLIASGGETSVTVTKSVAERFTAIALRISAASWHGTTPPEVSTGVTGSSVSPNPDVLNPAGWATEDTLWIAAMLWDDSLGTGSVTAYPYAANNLVSDVVSSAGRGALCTTESAVASIDPGAFTISPTDQWWAGTVAVRPAVVSYELNLVAGSYALIGTLLTTLKTKLLALNPAVYTLAGQPATLFKGYTLNLESGSYLLTGSALTALANRLLSLTAGNYALSGAEAALLAQKLLSLAAGQYLINGQPLSTFANRLLNLASGQYLLSGSNAGLLSARLIILNTGIYLYTGVDANLIYTPGGAFALNLEAGMYLLSGTDATLTVAGLPLPTPPVPGSSGSLHPLYANWDRIWGNRKRKLEEVEADDIELALLI